MPDEIVQTWESLATILSQAEIIIPGHGEAIRMTASLLQELLLSFQTAEYAERCQTIVPLLQKRLQQFHE